MVVGLRHHLGAGLPAFHLVRAQPHELARPIGRLEKRGLIPALVDGFQRMFGQRHRKLIAEHLVGPDVGLAPMHDHGIRSW